MDQDVEEYVRTCKKRNKHKTLTKDKAPVPTKITVIIQTLPESYFRHCGSSTTNSRR